MTVERTDEGESTIEFDVYMMVTSTQHPLTTSIQVDR